MLQTYLQEALKLCNATDHPAIAALLCPFPATASTGNSQSGSQTLRWPLFEQHSGWMICRRPLKVPVSTQRAGNRRWCVLTKKKFSAHVSNDTSLAGCGPSTSSCAIEMALEGIICFSAANGGSDDESNSRSLELVATGGGRLILTAPDSYAHAQWIECFRARGAWILDGAASQCASLLSNPSTPAHVSAAVSVQDPQPPFGRFFWVGATTPDHTAIASEPRRRRSLAGLPEEVDDLLAQLSVCDDDRDAELRGEGEAERAEESGSAQSAANPESSDSQMSRTDDNGVQVSPLTRSVLDTSMRFFRVSHFQQLVIPRHVHLAIWKFSSRCKIIVCRLLIQTAQ
eukprot:SAG31_NODE_3956_length_3720_cov_1.296879_3_plen_343_part_00